MNEGDGDGPGDGDAPGRTGDDEDEAKAEGGNNGAPAEEGMFGRLGGDAVLPFAVVTASDEVDMENR